jgi:hypothetical protein
MEQTTEDEKQSRIEKCKKCEHIIFDEQGKTKCAVCNCSLSLLTSDLFAKCPKGFW